jgi:tellurite methyltransferase
VSSEPLATAHEVWDRNWSNPEQRARWLEPHPSVQALVPLLRARGLTRVLDVGCGVGRHAQYLASQGFTCAGIHASQSGLEYARVQATQAGLHIDYRVGPFYALPYADRSFDALIAWNVIYHGDLEVAQRAIDEFARVLVRGGLYIGTMLSQRNRAYGVGREVSRDTYVVDDASDDKVHPHLYLSAAQVVALYRGFEALMLEDVEQGSGHHHWHVIFERVT